MLIKMLTSGESPDFGPFSEGDELDIPHTVGQVLIDRGVAVELTKPCLQACQLAGLPAQIKEV